MKFYELVKSRSAIDYLTDRERLLSYGQIEAFGKLVKGGWDLSVVFCDRVRHNCEISPEGSIEAGPDHWLDEALSEDCILFMLELWGCDWVVKCDGWYYARVPRLLSWNYTYFGTPVPRTNWFQESGIKQLTPSLGPVVTNGGYKAEAITGYPPSDDDDFPFI